MRINGFKQYFILGMLLITVASFIVTKDGVIPLILLSFLGDVLILWLFLYLEIFIHEFGHAIAGWLVKFPVPKIVIGFGPNLFKYQLKSTTLVVNWGMQGGLTHPGSMSSNWLRLRYFFFTLGGVGLQAVSLILVILIITLIEIISPGFLTVDGIWSKMIGFFFFTNILLMVINLIPFQINLMGIPMPNDGLVLLTIFFMKQEKIQEILLSGKILEGVEYLEEKDFQQAAAIFQECSLRYPTLILPKINLSAALIRQEKIDEAINLLGEILTEIEHTPQKSKDPKRILVLNNLAWSNLLKSIKDKDSNCLRLGDEYSAQAIALNNKPSPIFGTRACILIEMGQTDEGIKLLKKLVNLHQPVNEKTNHPIGFLYLAYAYYQKNNHQESQKYWQKIKDNQDLNSSEYQILANHIIKKTNYFYID